MTVGTGDIRLAMHAVVGKKFILEMADEANLEAGYRLFPFQVGRLRAPISNQQAM